MRGKHSIGGWVLDGLLWLAAAAFSIQMFHEAKSGMELSGLAALFGIVIVCGLSIIWIPFRMARRVLELANVDRRMELATTFVKPAPYLARNLWGLALRAALPAILAPPYLLLSLDWRNRSDWEAGDAMQWISVSSCFLWIVWVIWLGQLDWLARLCKRNKGGGMIYVPMLWAVASVAIPGGSCWIVLAVLGQNDLIAEPVAYGLIALLEAATLYALWRRWRTLCRVYYVFDK